MTIYSEPYGYVYKITNNITKEFYFGSRTATISKRILPENDLWISYFTSSTVINEQIERFGKETFTPEILFKSNDSDLVFWTEQLYIKNNIQDSHCLNLHYMDKDLDHKVFSTQGRPAWNKGVPSIMKGIPRSSETISRMTKNRKGKNIGQTPWNKGKKSIYTEDALSVMSKKASERVGEKNSFYGKTHSEDTKEKLRSAQKKTVACPHCGQTGANSIMQRWHFDNCKKRDRSLVSD